jgi:predicted O-methyltransferase YrrM
MNYRHNHTWFLYSEIKNLLLKFINQNAENRVLEIGSFEGLSACYFSDNLLSHEKSTLDCVDPFLTSDTTTSISENTYDIFCENIKKSKHYSKCQHYKMLSSDFFPKLDSNKLYNFIYIDGSHLPNDITYDMENSFAHLEKGGIMWMDDYLGGDGIVIKHAMDDFLEKYKGKYERIHQGYQLAIRKII